MHHRVIVVSLNIPVEQNKIVFELSELTESSLIFKPPSDDMSTTKPSTSFLLRIRCPETGVEISNIDHLDANRKFVLSNMKLTSNIEILGIDAGLMSLTHSSIK